MVTKIAERFAKLALAEFFSDVEYVQSLTEDSITRYVLSVKKDSIIYAEKILKSLEDKNCKELEKILKSGELSRKVVFEQTGIKCNSDKIEDINQTLILISGKDNFDKFIAEKILKEEDNKKVRAEKEFYYLTEQLKNKKYTRVIDGNNQIVSAKDLLDEKLAGFNVRIEKRKNGAVWEYSIWSEVNGKDTGIVLNGMKERLYVEHFLLDKSTQKP